MLLASIRSSKKYSSLSLQDMVSDRPDQSHLPASPERTRFGHVKAIIRVARPLLPVAPIDLVSGRLHVQEVSELFSHQDRRSNVHVDMTGEM
jgi:hypothetical protein